MNFIVPLRTKGLGQGVGETMDELVKMGIRDFHFAMLATQFAEYAIQPFGTFQSLSHMCQRGKHLGFQAFSVGGKENLRLGASGKKGLVKGGNESFEVHPVTFKAAEYYGVAEIGFH